MEDDSPLEMCHSQSQTQRWGDGLDEFMDTLEILDDGAMANNAVQLRIIEKYPLYPPIPSH